MHESDNYTKRTSTLDCFCVCGGMCVLTIPLCHWRSWWWLLVNIEQLDHVQELPTGLTWASCHININAHNSDQLEAVHNFPWGQIRVSDISFKVQVKDSGSENSSFAANVSRFSEVGQLPGTLQLERLNEGCGIEAAMVTNNALYH